MLNTTLNKLNKLKNNFYKKRIAVIGDMMLDYYYWGSVSRISPEAPVPVIEVEKEFARFGGAMNVVYNILTLGGIPIPIGVVGNDNDGKKIRSLLKENNISDKTLITEKDRLTTTKTRVIADTQHIVRIDKEKTFPISTRTEKKVLSTIKNNIHKIDAIILQDYNKGMLTQNLIEKIIDIANKSKKIITVDPKFNNYFLYQNVTVFKPNRKETEDAFGIRIKTKNEITHAGHKLLKEMNAKYILLTLGEEGIALFEKDKPEKRIPTKARKVSDVSGAGDTVISTITMALAAGADIYDAAYLANYAGGIVCQDVGIVPIAIDHLFNTISSELK